MKIAIIGTGGAGGYFGGKLALAGNNVTFLARGEHLKAIKENGLSVKSISGDFHVHPAKATDKISDTTSERNTCSRRTFIRIKSSKYTMRIM